MIKKFIVGFVIGLTVAVAVLSLVLVAAYAIEDIRHGASQDLQGHVCEEKLCTASQSGRLDSRS